MQERGKEHDRKRKGAQQRGSTRRRKRKHACKRNGQCAGARESKCPRLRERVHKRGKLHRIYKESRHER